MIPDIVKKAAGVREGEDLLVVAIGDTIVMKKLSAVSFQEVAKPIWKTVRSLGLSGEDLDELIEEARIRPLRGRRNPR